MDAAPDEQTDASRWENRPTQRVGKSDRRLALNNQTDAPRRNKTFEEFHG